MKEDGEDLSQCLPDNLQKAWDEKIAEGVRPILKSSRYGSWYVGSPRGKADNTQAPTESTNAESQNASQPPPRKIRFKLVDFFDMHLGGDELPYLVEEFIPSKGIVLAWGQPKCLKSFLMFSASFHIAMGWEFHGRSVQQGTVVYLAFEGGHGFVRRKEALLIHHKVEEKPGRLLIMAGMANLINEHKLLIEDLKYQLKEIVPIAVVLDTLNKSFVGSESKDTDMANYIRAAEAVRAAFDCVVIIVHHCGLDESRPRGHTSLPGAVDAQIAITRQDMTVTAEVEFMRDGPEGTIVSGRAEKIPIGFDANGQELTSLVITPIDGEPLEMGHPKASQWPRAFKVFHEALLEATLSHGFDFQINGGPRVKAVNVDDVREAFYERLVIASTAGTTTEQKQDSKRRAFARAVNQARARNLIGGRSLPDGREILWLAHP